MNGQFDYRISSQEIHDELKLVAQERKKKIVDKKAVETDNSRCIIAICSAAIATLFVVCIPIKQYEDKATLGSYVTDSSSPTITMGNETCIENNDEWKCTGTSDNEEEWYDPKYGYDDALDYWQVKPYGKLYHERDLMGRNL